MRTQRIDTSVVMTKLATSAITGMGIIFIVLCALVVGINYFGNPQHASPIASVALFDDNTKRRPVYLAEANISDYGYNRPLSAGYPTSSVLNNSVGQMMSASETSSPLRSRNYDAPAFTEQVRPPKKTKKKPKIIRANGNRGQTDSEDKTDDKPENRQKIIKVNEEPPQPTININGKTVPVGLPKLDALQDSLATNTTPTLGGNTQLSMAQVAPRRMAMHDQARAFTPHPTRPKVSIIIGGLGLNGRLTKQAINDLPADVSLSFIPHANSLKRYINMARNDGHEVLVEVPMEPQDYGRFRPHPKVLTTKNTPEENIRRLQDVIAGAPGIFGIMNYQGGKFALNRSAISPIMQALKQFDIAMVDDGSIPGSLLSEASNEIGAAFTQADLQIDARETSSDILLKLAELEAIARQKGHAVGAGYALPLTLEAIKQWSADLDRRGLQLVPISASLENVNPRILQ